MYTQRLHRATLRLLSALLLVALPAPATAQSSRTFTACYVPDVGAVYLIKEDDLSTSCLSQAHQEFSWTEGEGSGMELLDGSVTVDKLADGAVLTNKLGNAAVTSQKIANAAVESVHIADGTITSDDLATGSVTGAEIANGSISGAHLATGAVSSSRIADNSILASDLASSSVGESEIAFGAVTANKIATDAVTGPKIADGAVTASKLNVSYARLNTPATILAQSSQTITVSCANREVLSVGFDPSVRGALDVLFSYPSEDNTWQIRFRNNTPGPVVVDVWRICVDLK